MIVANCMCLSFGVCVGSCGLSAICWGFILVLPYRWGVTVGWMVRV